MKLFVADLQPTVLKILQQACKSQEFEIEVIESRAQLLEKIAQYPASILMYDANLVSQQEAELYEKIRQVERVPMLAFISKDAQVQTEIGLHETIQKPFRAQAVMQKIKGMFESAQGNANQYRYTDEYIQ
ncbi:MAG: response regulator, partial [Culicoidibacterales bacterium]